MTLSHLTDNTFVGIDVGGAGLDVAWHRGDSAHYANRPDAIATLVERLRTGPEVTRIVVEPTGGYEKAAGEGAASSAASGRDHPYDAL